MKMGELNLTQLIAVNNILKELPSNLTLASIVERYILFEEWYMTNDPEVWNKIVELMENKNNGKDVHSSEGS